MIILKILICLGATLVGLFIGYAVNAMIQDYRWWRKTSEEREKIRKEWNDFMDSLIPDRKC